MIFTRRKHKKRAYLFLSSSINILFATGGLAFPLVSFITKPIKNLIGLSFPSLKSAITDSFWLIRLLIKSRNTFSSVISVNPCFFIISSIFSLVYVKMDEDNFKNLVTKVSKKEISSKVCKEILPIMLETNENIDEIIKKQDLS